MASNGEYKNHTQKISSPTLNLTPMWRWFTWDASNSFDEPTYSQLSQANPKPSCFSLMWFRSFSLSLVMKSHWSQMLTWFHGNILLKLGFGKYMKKKPQKSDNLSLVPQKSSNFLVFLS